MYKSDLRVKIGSLILKNPVMPASGTYSYLDENANVFSMDELGAIVTKSVHRNIRVGNPPPRIAETTAGMLNSVGIPSEGVDEFIDKKLPALLGLNSAVIVSISGSCTKDFIESAKKISDIQGVSAIELNLSCPNVGSGLQFASDPVLLGRVVEGVRAVTGLTVMVKLSPNITDIRLTSGIAEDCGADAVVIANTFMGMKIDINKQRPVLGNTIGGLSGPAIRPIVLRMVYQAYEVLKIPIIACGGVTCFEDALEYILAGASAVQVGCFNFVNPRVMIEVIEGIDDYLFKRGYKSLCDIRGIAHNK